MLDFKYSPVLICENGEIKTNITYYFNYENHLVLDGFNTWPECLINLLTKHTKELSEYLREEERFDKLAETDVMLRINRPVNSREEFWLDKLSQIRNIIKNIILYMPNTLDL